VAWERVYTVNNFWDRPRLGIADVSGRPHIFESLFDVLHDDYRDFYFVSPIDTELFVLALEDWEIWNRWCEAFDRGETSRETHPALPEDRSRHDEIVRLIGPRLKADPTKSKKLKDAFRNLRRGWSGVEVEWSEADA